MTLVALIQVHRSKLTFVIAGRKMRRGEDIEIRRDLLKETEAIALIKRNTTEDDFEKIIKINIHTIIHFKTIKPFSHGFQKIICRE